MQKIFKWGTVNFLRIHIPPSGIYFLTGSSLIILLFYFGEVTHVQEKTNLLDFYFKIFNDYFFFTYIFHTFLLIVFSMLLPRISVQKNYMIRFKSKLAWFFQVCLLLFNVSLLCIGGLCIMMLLIGVFYLPTDTAWSEFARSSFQITDTQGIISPLKFLFFQLIFSLLFAYIIALCLFVSWIFTLNIYTCFILPLLLHLLGIISISGILDFLPTCFPLNQLLHSPIHWNAPMIFAQLAVLIIYIVWLLAIGAWKIRRKDLTEKNEHI